MATWNEFAEKCAETITADPAGILTWFPTGGSREEAARELGLSEYLLLAAWLDEADTSSKHDGVAYGWSPIKNWDEARGVAEGLLADLETEKSGTMLIAMIPE